LTFQKKLIDGAYAPGAELNFRFFKNYTEISYTKAG
jgi:hypothetical protein